MRPYQAVPADDYDYGFEDYSRGIVKKIDCRVVISENLKKQMISYYDRYSLSIFSNRLITINNYCSLNSITLDELKLKFRRMDTIKIVWIGRNSVEKRPEIFIEVSKRLQNNVSFEFSIVGPGFIEDDLKVKRLNIKGVIKKDSELVDFLKSQHIILITSYRAICGH